MKVLAIRGATTVPENDCGMILNESKILVEKIIKENNLEVDDIISIIFTMTSDLDSVYPSVCVRENLGYCDIPLLNFEEKKIIGSLEKCIRVMMYINTKKIKSDIKHIYLNNAKCLRCDIRSED